MTFAANAEKHNWKNNQNKMFEKIGLMSIAKYSAQNYTYMVQQDDGHWKASIDVEGVKTGWQVKGCGQAPW